MKRTFLLLLILLCTACTALKRCGYEGVNRDEWQQPEKVIRTLNIKPGEYVADLGSGGGYFTFRLARAVGPNGKVYAADVDEGLNEDLRKRLREKGIQNTEVVLAKTHDPSFPSRVDLIFTVNTYHHIADRARYFANLRQYLRPGGRIAIVEFRGKTWFSKFFGHYTAPAVIKEEMAEAGYPAPQEFDFLPRQSFLIYEASPPLPAKQTNHRGTETQRKKYKFIGHVPTWNVANEFIKLSPYYPDVPSVLKTTVLSVSLCLL